MTTTERARKAGKARQAQLSPEQRTELSRKGSLAAAVAQVVNAAPELTQEQVDRLRAIFAPAMEQEATD